MTIRQHLTSRTPRILFLDAYDSFTNNIVALLKETTGADVEIIRIDDHSFLKEHGNKLGGEHTAFADFIQRYDAVVAGPGPGNPTNSKDVGLIEGLWSLPREHILPVLGICLGFQSMCLAYGAEIERLRFPRHGLVTDVTHSRDSIFRGISRVQATQYHSLHVKIDRDGLDLCDLEQLLASEPTPQCSSLRPLAWDLSDPANGPVLMAAKHVEYPFYGMQYHPESICTNEEGARVIQNWWSTVRRWNRARPAPPRHINPKTSPPPLSDEPRSSLRLAIQHLNNSHSPEVHWSTIPSDGLSVEQIYSALVPNDEAILFESGLNKSGLPLRADTGRTSLIGLVPPGTLRFYYYAQRQRVEIWSKEEHVETVNHVKDLWKLFRGITAQLKSTGGPLKSPFWGGFMGFASYEAGLESIDIRGSPRRKDRPDACFAFVTRSIVVDHQQNHIYVQSIQRNDQLWISKTKLNLLDFEGKQNKPDGVLRASLKKAKVEVPLRTSYIAKVKKCQEYICAGESYELCLTDQTKVSIPRLAGQSLNSWALYQNLRRLNPAPFGAYFRLGNGSRGIHIVSSSPERFLSWDRKGTCQFRPIKGTFGKGPKTTREQAERHLNSTKELAENLMIVDLIRHDLHGVVGAGNVHMAKLMGIEEYETVYQLVSVIEGNLNGSASASVSPKSSSANPTGIDVLAASLPPGSMTGAPKRRSCTLLQEIEENKPRGIYSGILGFLDVGGGGDFAVVIRTAFHWDDDTEIFVEDGATGEGKEGVYDVWHVGAGGAVTAQSTPEGEYEEMVTKRDSTLRMFDAALVPDEESL
ncbi:para-aminobenzoate synthase [Aulographum hederae CBS 113979]|uniref:aminodeoxychorismate synthase n=1 Tax=Aulographum hederae CBS 113979 TaxID=1176131 RepID=A0A6G1HAE0_9PEZI|nr:para-aminobenzoate synthase [Aulographum hederae CBS 113979]